MYPTREEAERILAGAKARYDQVSKTHGRWDDHCRTAARCAERSRPGAPASTRTRRMCWACCTTSAGGTATATSATSIMAGSI